jgi:hypothetical protein
MGRTKLFLVVVALSVLALVDAHAAAYDGADHYAGCTQLVALSECAADSTAEAATGHVTAATSLKTRLQGYAPALLSENANATAIVSRSFSNSEPVSALRITAIVHVTDAAAHLVARPALIGYAGAFINVNLQVYEKGPRCYLLTFCSLQDGYAEIATLWKTGDVHVEDQDVTVSGVYYGCGGIPAGTADIVVDLNATSQIGSTTAPGAGESSTSIDAVVTSLTVEPAAAPPSYCS